MLLQIYGVLVGSVAFTSHAQASFDFDSLSQSDVDGVNRDFSALMAHTTASPPASLTQVGGFEFGVVAGLVTAPTVSDLVSENSDDAPTKLPHGGLIGVYSISEEKTIEAKIIPHTKIEETSSIASYSFAYKYSFLDKKELPTVVSALRGQLTYGNMRLDQTINNSSTLGQDVDAEIKFTTISVGVVYLTGYRMALLDTILFEPFAGAGVLYSKADLDLIANTSVTIFDIPGSSIKSTQIGAILIAGVQFHFYFFKLAFEYNRVFESNKYTIKIAAGY